MYNLIKNKRKRKNKVENYLEAFYLGATAVDREMQ